MRIDSEEATARAAEVTQRGWRGRLLMCSGSGSAGERAWCSVKCYALSSCRGPGKGHMRQRGEEGSNCGLSQTGSFHVWTVCAVQVFP